MYPKFPPNLLHIFPPLLIRVVSAPALPVLLEVEDGGGAHGGAVADAEAPQGEAHVLVLVALSEQIHSD